MTALVRNPEKLHIEHPHLTVFKGNVLDSASVEEAVVGKDAVLSALGHKRWFIKTTILSKGTKNIYAKTLPFRIDTRNVHSLF